MLYIVKLMGAVIKVVHVIPLQNNHKHNQLLESSHLKTNHKVFKSFEPP